MRRVSNLLLAFGFVGALASAHAATTVTISFDGFCDGMMVTTGDSLVGGSLTGCYTGIILGNKGIDYGLIPLDGTTGVVSNVQSSADGSSEILTYYLDFDNNTWANYVSSGGIPGLLNSGTFTVTGPNFRGNPGAPPSGVKQNNALPPALPFYHTVTLQFTGYCNGMMLTFAGDLVAGTQTGCTAGVLVAGNTGKDFGVPPFAPDASGVAANVGATENGAGTLTMFILDFANKVATSYYTNNGVPQQLQTSGFTLTAGDNAVFDNGPAFGKQ